MSDDDLDPYLAPLEEAHAPSTFASIVFRGWGVKLSGFGWAIVTAAASYAFGPYAGLACAILAGICIYVVCYQAWRSERLRSDGFALELRKLRDSAGESNQQTIAFYERLLEPQLEIDFDSIGTVTAHYPFNRAVCYCRVARFAIKNTGKMTVYGIEASVDLGWRADSETSRPLYRKDEFSEHDKGTFSLDAGKEQFIDIAKQKDDTSNSEGAYLRLVGPAYVNRAIGYSELSGLRITVTAMDHPPLEFRVDLYFQEVPYADAKGSGVCKRLMCRKSDKTSTEAKPGRR